MTRALAVWDRFWFEPLPTSTLALLRIAFGLLTFAWTLSLSPDLLSFFSTRGILPAQPDYGESGAWGLLGFLSGDVAVVVVYFALLLGSLCLLFGFKTRLAALLVWVCLLSFIRRDPWVFNSGDLYLQVLAFYFVLAPSGASLSIDRWLTARERFWEYPVRAAWPLRLFQIQVSVLYLAALWAKVRGGTWNEGTAVSYALRIGDLERFSVPAFVTDSIVISNFLTFGTLATELAIGILVWNRKLRPWVLLAGVGLHLGIDYAVRVGFFSYVILVAYLAFLPPERATSWIASARKRWGRSRLSRGRFQPAGPAS
jgi:hypothetical protein